MGPAQALAGDVCTTPIHSGAEPSRTTVALVRSPSGGEDPTTGLEPVPDADHQQADQA